MTQTDTAAHVSVLCVSVMQLHNDYLQNWIPVAILLALAIMGALLIICVWISSERRTEHWEPFCHDEQDCQDTFHQLQRGRLDIQPM